MNRSIALLLFYTIANYTALASIVYHDFDDVVLHDGSGHFAYMDLDAASSSEVFSLQYDVPPQADLRFKPQGPEQFYMDVYNSWAVHEVDSSWVALFEAGQLISSTGSIDPVSSTIAYNGIASSPWDGQDGTTKSYIGLVNSTTSQVAWVGVFYNSENNHLTITDFAVANFSDMMVAGQTEAVVPEPAETCLATVLLLGLFMAYRKRPGQKPSNAMAV